MRSSYRRENLPDADSSFQASFGLRAEKLRRERRCRPSEHFENDGSAASVDEGSFEPDAVENPAELQHDRFLSTEHLGTEAVAAFVDGELSPTARRRAMAHLLMCPECRQEVAVQREASRRLRNSCELHIPAELRSRLTNLNNDIRSYSSSAGDNQSDTRHLARRRPESISAAVEHMFRSVRKGTANRNSEDEA